MQNPYYSPISQSQQLCQNNAWCTYQAVDRISIWVQISTLLLITILTIIVLRYLYVLLQYRKQQKYKQLFGVVFVRVFAIALMWVLCTGIKICINVMVFYDYIQYDVDTLPQPTRESPLVYWSAIFYLFDSASTFFIISLILMIPYQWYVLSLNQVQDITDTFKLHNKINPPKFPHTSAKILHISQISAYIHAIPYINITILFNINSINDNNSLWMSVNACQGFISVVIAICQSIFMLVIYGVIYYVAEHTKKYKLVAMRKQDYSRLKVQYILLVIAILSRILLNSFFNGLADKILHYQPSANCSDRVQDITLHHNDIKRTIFLILGYLIMHILPISLVIYIYKPSLQDRERDQNILKYQGSSSKSDRSSVQNLYVSGAMLTTGQIQNHQNKQNKGNKGNYYESNHYAVNASGEQNYHKLAG